MKKVRITILKTTLGKDLAEECGVEHLGAYPLMRQGQVFYTDYVKPEGFCDKTWKAIYRYVFTLAHGAGSDVSHYGDWIKALDVAICSCNDSLRSTIMKLEATEEMAQR